MFLLSFLTRFGVNVLYFLEKKMQSRNVQFWLNILFKNLESVTTFLEIHSFYFLALIKIIKNVSAALLLLLACNFYPFRVSLKDLARWPWIQTTLKHLSWTCRGPIQASMGGRLTPCQAFPKGEQAEKGVDLKGPVVAGLQRGRAQVHPLNRWLTTFSVCVYPELSVCDLLNAFYHP